MSTESMALPVDLAAFGEGTAASSGAGAPPSPQGEGFAGRGAPGAPNVGEGLAPPAGTSTDDAPAGDHAGSPLRGSGGTPTSPAPDPFAAARAYHAKASEFAAVRCARWLAEAEALAGSEPDFDLAAACRSRACTALLRAGLPLRTAWRAANVDNLVRRAAEEARAAVAADIRARGARPGEAGAAAVPAFGQREDVSRLSDAEVRAVLGRLERREHVSFG